jgi:hypothetical protein
MSAEPYYRGRSDYIAGKYMPPKEYGMVERAQWDMGYRDQHLNNPDPIIVQTIMQTVYDLRDGRSIPSERIDALENIAHEIESRCK